MSARTLAKTVVYLGDDGFGMAILRPHRIIHFEALRQLLGLTIIRLATETELAALFPECELGAMPPFGNLVAIPVLMDESLAAAEFIAFNAGTHRDVIHMSGADFRKLVKPLVAAFAVKEPAAVGF